jgi:DNA-binding NarL/FixJ family response regulator
MTAMPCTRPTRTRLPHLRSVPAPVVTTPARSAPQPATVPPVRPAPAWVSLLSAREEEVLRCVARGMSNAEIAAELFISLATVKSHVARLLDKLRARDRVQLVVEVYRTGYVPVR